MDLLERVEDYIACDRLLRPGDRVLVAVSGGPDSLALLHLFTRLRAPWALGLHAVHVNHGLRPEAAQDAAFVESVGQAWGVPVTVVAVDVRAERAPGESLQQAGAAGARSVLAQAADQVSATRIALGHHGGPSG